MFLVSKLTVRFIGFLFFLAVFLYLNPHYIFALDAPESKTESTSAVSPDMEVYISRRGLAFHQKDCSVIQGYEVKKATLPEAVEKGMRPCAVCFKDNTALDVEVQKEAEQKNRGEKLEYLK